MRFKRFIFLIIICFIFLGVKNSFSTNNVFSTKAIKALEGLLNADGESAFQTDPNGNAAISGELSVETIKQTSDTLKQCIFSYYVDPDAADQGADTTSSFKNIIDTVGSGRDVEVVFPSGDPNNIFTFSTNEVSGSNIYLRIEPGAFISIDTSRSLTVYSPDHIIASPQQKIKIGSGALNFTAAGTIHPGWYGTPINGSDDSTSYWTEINTAMVANSTIKLLEGADYFINTSGGITFSKTVSIDGFGAKFTCGVTVGNHPTITLSANKSKVYGFEIDCTSNHTDGGDDDFQDAGDSFDNNLRRGLKVTGDDVEVNALIDTNCVAGISFEATDGGSIHNCKIVNSIITSGVYGTQNNYNTGIRLAGVSNCNVYSNIINGHGQGILVSEQGTVEKVFIFANQIYDPSNNGIYVSSGDDCSIFFNTVSGHDSTGIKARASNHHIAFNKIFCTQSTVLGGITVTGNGAPDVDGYNGQGTQVENNIISGDAANGIWTAKQDAGSFKDLVIRDNNFQWNSSPSQNCDSVKFVSCKSIGAIISGNKSINHSNGIVLTVEDPNTEYHDDVTITENIVNGGTEDGIALQNIRYSEISDNQSKKCATNKSGLLISNCSYNKIHDNDFSDYQGSATMSYGVEALSGSDYNYYYHNDTSGVVTSSYTGLGANSTTH